MIWVKTDSNGFIDEYCTGPKGSTPPKGFVKADKEPEVGRSYLDNGTVIMMPEQPSSNHVADRVNKQWVLDEQLLANEVRVTRNRLISDTDWTQLPDVSLATRDKWKAYRQALRDITTQPGYPKNVKWPLKPV